MFIKINRTTINLHCGKEIDWLVVLFTFIFFFFFFFFFFFGVRFPKLGIESWYKNDLQNSLQRIWEVFYLPKWDVLWASEAAMSNSVMAKSHLKHLSHKLSAYNNNIYIYLIKNQYKAQHLVWLYNPQKICWNVHMIRWSKIFHIEEIHKCIFSF